MPARIMPVTISGLYIYPIKSCAGIAVDSLHLDAMGATHDRRYMLVDEQGVFVTQRQQAALVHIGVAVHEQGWMITLPDIGEKVLPFQGVSQQPTPVKVWSDTFVAYDQGDEWAALFSCFLGKPVRLVYTGLQTERQIDAAYCETARPVSFADGFPLLLANESSLRVLQEYLMGKLESPLVMMRFRPNIVVKGAGAWAENQWKQLHINVLVLSLVKPCSRCVIPTINLQSANKEPVIWKALETFCKADDGKVYFGQNLIHQSNGILRIGDEVLCR